MSQEAFTELRSKISSAREACAGSNVQPRARLQRLVYEAIELAVQKRLYGLAKDLRVIYREVGNITEYGDRLEPDQKLCDLLNRLDHSNVKNIC